MSIFELAGKITIDKSGFDSGLSHAESAAKAFGEKFDKIAGGVKKALTAAFSIAAVTKLTRAVIDLANETSAYGDTIDKQSQVLGMTRKGYQEWDYILGQNGISIDSMSGAMRALNNSMMDAIEGSEESTNAFAQLGLHIQELEKLNPEQQFEEVVRALQKMPAGAEKSALAMKLLGRGGMSLMPLLNSESATIDELRQRAYELGIIMSDDAVDASVAYGDAMDDLKKTFNGIKYAMGAQLLPTLTKGVTALTNYAAKISHAYQEKGLRGVFDTLVEDFKAIPWPTWEDVQGAIESGWNSIVTGVQGLAKLVFGENVDGTIKWPTWEDIGSAITTAWSTIVKGVQDLGNTVGKLVFGENVDGEIDWPTWSEIGTAIGTAWSGIVDGVSNLGTTVGKAIFGENVDGTIKWPTWEEIGALIQTAWQGIVNGVSELGTSVGKVVFGENVDGTVKWPTWEDIGTAVTDAWDKIKTETAKLAGLMFGVSSDDTEALKQIGNTIEIIAGAIGAGMVASNIATAFNAMKSVLSLPSANPILLAISGIAAGAIFIAQNWETIYGWIERATDAMLNFFGIQTHYTEKDVRQANVDALSAAVGQLTEQASNMDRQGAIETIKGLLGTRAKDFLSDEQIMRIKSDQFGSTPEEVDAFLGDIYSTLSKSLEDEQSALAATEEAMASLNGQMSELETSASKASSALAAITAPDLTKYMTPEAKGLWSVPYDDFPARLHRGERVLTASQARRKENNIDLSGLGSEITQSIRAGMEGVTVRSYINGRDVTREVNKDLTRQVKARRFAT